MVPRLRRFSFILLSISIFFAWAAIPFSVQASTTDGTIDTTSKYAWGEDLGWLNFGTTGGDVHVTDASLTGYVWSQNYGWINLAPTGSGVTNNGEGDLSGQAWGENLGYIDFANVSITSAGLFAGTASGTVSGQISFDCTNCSVVTDWRPVSTRGSGSGGGGGGSGGGGSTPPSLGVLINNNAPRTISPNVTLQFSFDPSIGEMLVSNYSDFRDGAREPIRVTKDWNLCSENGIVRSPCFEGVRTVYVRFYATGGLPYGPYTDSILFATSEPSTPPVVPPPSGPRVPPPSSTPFNFLGAIGEILGSFLPDFLKPNKPVAPAVPPVPVIPFEAPLSFRSRWQLLPERAIREFVFAPLPSDFALLLKKFPELARIARDVEITRASDLTRLYGISLALPGFMNTSLEQSFQAIATASSSELQKLREVVLKLPGFGTSTLPGISLARLPVEVKNNVPSEVVFVRTADETIDFDIGVRLNKDGGVEQQVSTISGTLLKLVVRPEHPAAQVSGYLAFESRKQKPTSFNGFSLQSMLGSIVYQVPNGSDVAPDFRYRLVQGVASAIETLLGRNTNPNIEERFSLKEFTYTDPDHDGIYSATIQAPVVDGEYQIYTVIKYSDPTLHSNEIKITALIDPEGYVYEKVGGKETRIPGAIASIFSLDQGSSKYRLWEAHDYGQENPQITDVRGTYAFLVPPGYYYITIEAPGYKLYTSKPFEVTAGSSGVHENIRLTTTYGWLKALDWKTILLVFVTMLLLYNFYKDRRRNAGIVT